MQIKLFTIPNLLTLSNLLCGSFAAVSALVYNDLSLAFWLVVAAGVFDFFDGFVARLLGCPSAIGVELDSLADVISFGFAPAAVLFTMYGKSVSMGEWSETVVLAGGFAIFILAAFSALRLAKFNIDDTQHEEFCGLPTPACALFCVSLGWLTTTGNLYIAREVIVGVALVMSLLLVSPIRMFSFKFKGFGWADNQLRYIFLVGCVLLIVLLERFAVPVIILLYILTSAVRWLTCRSKVGKEA